MGRQPCCDKVGLKKGPWTSEEDKKLINFILTNGQCCWRAVPKLAGLLRCGKSCRLRWTNYLRPDLKRGLLSEDEEKIVIDLHAQLGNRWSKIASRLPGRTDNEIKNHWNTHIKKKLKKMGLDPLTHKPLPLPPAADQPPSSPPELTAIPDKIDEHNSTVTTESTNTELTIYEDKMATMFVGSMELINDFCIDEIPVIEPHEIQISYDKISSTPSSSSSSSSYTNSCDGGASLSNELEDLQFSQIFDDSYNEIMNSDIIWDEDFSSCLDMLINYDGDVNRESPVTPYMVSDEESWKYALMEID